MFPGWTVKQQPGSGDGGTKVADEKDRRGVVLAIYPLNITGH